MYQKKKSQPYYTNRHSCFLLQYHMVLVTEYRKPVLTGEVKKLVYRTIRDIFSEKGLNILEMNGEADHVHILFEADPYTTPGELVNVVKTKTSRFSGATATSSQQSVKTALKLFRLISETSKKAFTHAHIRDMDVVLCLH